LQGADEAASIKSGKGQIGERDGAAAQAISGATEPVRAKGGIEQRLDSGWRYGGQGFDLDQRGLLL